MQNNLTLTLSRQRNLAILLLVFFSKDVARLAGEICRATIGYAGFILLSSTESQRCIFSAAKVADWFVISAAPLLLFWIGIKITGTTLTETGLTKPRKTYTDILIALGIATVILPVIALYKSAWDPLAALKALTHISPSSNFINFISFNNWTAIFQDKLNPATLLFFGPLTEEFLCTGLLYAVLRGKYSANAAILGTALVFTLPHSFRLAVNIDFFSPNPVTSAIKFYGVGLFALFQFAHSVIACRLRDIRGTIWPAVFLHIFMNFITAYLKLHP